MRSDEKQVTRHPLVDITREFSDLLRNPASIRPDSAVGRSLTRVSLAEPAAESAFQSVITPDPLGESRTIG